MLQSVQRFFQRYIQPEADAQAAPSEHALRLATGALLMEMVRADHDEAPGEEEAVMAALTRAFGLSDAESAELTALARERAEAAVSLREFTRLLNDHLSPERKAYIVELLWRVAYADGAVDKYEEHLVRKLAELLYVPHRAFIQAKHRAASNTRTGGA